jgi:cell surface protein SprA
VDFRKFYDLRARVQNAFLQGSADSLACTGVDLELVKRSGLPRGQRVNRYAACETTPHGSYLVYTSDPNVSPPNLAAVQEMAVGMVRVDSGGRSTDPLVPGDTLELWVDDIRVTDVEDTPGFAGELGLALQAGDIADIRVNVSRRDPYFRQLGEQPSFITGNNLDLASSIHLERFLPKAFGVSLPLTILHGGSGTDPYFLDRSDLRGDGIEGLRTPRNSATSYALTMR